MLPDIINGKLKIDIDGNTSIPNPTEIEKDPTSPFVGIGIDEFRENFKEIMLYFKAKKGKKKAEEYDKIIRNKSAVFTSHIPIYSTMLRPMPMFRELFSTDPSGLPPWVPRNPREPRFSLWAERLPTPALWKSPWEPPFVR